MKLTVIGSNPEYFNFISGCEIIEDYNEADIIVFSGTFNYRSATTKFNRIPSDKLVIGVGNAAEFIGKRYQCYIIDSTLRTHNESSQILFSSSASIIEGVLESKNLFIPNIPYKVHGFVEGGHYSFNFKDDREVSFIRMFNCPIIMSMHDNNKPYCLILHLNPKFISLTPIANYINKLVCAYKDLL